MKYMEVKTHWQYYRTYVSFLHIHFTNWNKSSKIQEEERRSECEKNQVTPPPGFSIYSKSGQLYIERKNTKH